MEVVKTVVREQMHITRVVRAEFRTKSKQRLIENYIGEKSTEGLRN